MPKFYALSGVTLGSFGMQWQVTPSDKDIVSDLIDELDNRRLLWELGIREHADRCAASASFMREYLGTLMRTPGVGRELKAELKAMQGHFRQFMTNLSTYGLDHRGPVDSQALDRVLSWLREPVGNQVGLLAAQYGLQVSDELARIVPNQNDWFFET